GRKRSATSHCQVESKLVRGSNRFRTASKEPKSETNKNESKINEESKSLETVNRTGPFFMKSNEVSQPPLRMNTRSVLLAVALLSATAYTGRAQPTIQFGATSYTFAESAGFATITVQRLGDLTTTVSVDYATADGTATNGLKYTAVSNTLAFGTSETNKTIVVPILNNGLVEGTKFFRVMLGNPTGGAFLGTRTNATVSITDNDVGIQFQLATYSVAEDAGTVEIGIVRGDDGILPVTVDFFTTALTAKGG